MAKRVYTYANDVVICTATPEPEISWSKDGKKLVPKKNKRVKIYKDAESDTNFLEIQDATVDDSGCYVVNAENAAGIGEVTVSVNVEEKIEAPVLENLPKPMQVKSGEPIVLAVQATGKPYSMVSLSAAI